MRQHLRFGRDFGILLFGGMLGQGITFATMPVVARLFTPSDFGSAAFFLSALSFLAPLASLRYEQAIPLPREESKARDLTVLPVLLAICLGALLLAGITAWDLAVGVDRTWRGVGAWAYALPLAVIANVLALTFSLRRAREGAFRRMSLAGVVGSSVTGGFRITLGAVLGSSVGGLIVSVILGDASRAAWLAGGERKLRPARFGVERWNSLRSVAREYRDFPVYNTPTGLLNRFTAEAPVFLLSLLFGPLVVGLYALVARALRAPVELGGEAARRVFLQRIAARANAARPFLDLYVGGSIGLLVLTLIPLLVIYFRGEAIFGLVFGAEWSEAGRYAKMLVPWLAVTIPTSAVYVVFSVTRRLGAWLALQALLGLLTVSVFTAAYYLHWSALETMEVYGWMQAGFYLVLATMGFLLCRGWRPDGAAVSPTPEKTA